MTACAMFLLTIIGLPVGGLLTWGAYCLFQSLKTKAQRWFAERERADTRILVPVRLAPAVAAVCCVLFVVVTLGYGWSTSRPCNCQNEVEGVNGTKICTPDQG